MDLAAHPVALALLRRGAAGLEGVARPEAGAPVPLFRVDSGIENYDAAADGSRFLVSMPAEKVRESEVPSRSS